jgi:hypothetical protein
MQISSVSERRKEPCLDRQGPVRLRAEAGPAVPGANQIVETSPPLPGRRGPADQRKRTSEFLDAVEPFASFGDCVIATAS